MNGYALWVLVKHTVRVYVVEFLKGVSWGCGLALASIPMGACWQLGSMLAQRMLNR